MIEFKLPDLGEGIEAGDVVSVAVSEGDLLQPEQMVLELETDKAILELPCPEGGRVVKVHVKVGDKVPVGGLLLTLEPVAGATAAAAEPAAETAPEEPPVEPAPAEEEPEAAAAPEEAPSASVPIAPQTEPEPPAAPAAEVRPRMLAEEGAPPPPAAPSTRRMARELGVDLHLVPGTGPAGRITPDDVQAYVKRLAAKAQAVPTGAAGTAPPLPDFSHWGLVEHRPLKSIRRKTAENMAVAWQMVPHVTQFDIADITDLEAGRRRFIQTQDDAPAKVTLTVLAMKAVVDALRSFPQFNSSLDTEAGELILKRYFHIGIAVDTEHGLMVPVIRNVDKKSILELAMELEDVAERARERKLALEEMRGGTFTITNLGGIGGIGFTPIVNYPEVAILGISRARQEYAVVDGEPEIRLMLPLSLSYDHRVIDGADGARFLRKVATTLSDPIHMLFAS